MTLLSDILKDVKILDRIGPDDVEAVGIAMDSREVKNDYLFAAIPGSAVDGHQFIDKAIAKGARIIVCETVPEAIEPNVIYLKVATSAKAIALIARNFFGNPAKEMTLVGITGTNGKTTVATLGWQLLKLLGRKSGLFSTVSVRINDDVLPATHTTPDIIQTYQRLKQMKEAGCEVVFMEVSSHALDQNRVYGLDFNVAVFTNATRDHLDYHGDFKSYLNAKKRLFDQLPGDSIALICVDDKHADYMVQNCSAEVRTYGLSLSAQYQARVLENSMSGLILKIDQTEVAFQISGSYNAQNLLAAYGIAECLGFEKEVIVEKWSLLTGAEGRMEKIRGKRGITAILDYAHTPDALDNLLKNVREMRTKRNTLITVVGCGGDRDKGKRPQMASIAVKYSDLIILTSDNPRSENPEAILDDMYEGVDQANQNSSFRITDRREAIKLACQLAKPGDIVVVAGKGHEKYQEINGKKFPFDDKQVLQQYL